MGAVAAAVTVGAVAVAVSGEPLVLVILLGTGVLLRDAWAWFASTHEERDAFRREVAWKGGGPDQRRFGDEWSPWVLVGLVAVVCVSLALMRFEPGFILPAFMVGSVLVAALVDRLWARPRGRTRRRLPGAA